MHELDNTAIQITNIKTFTFPFAAVVVVVVVVVVVEGNTAI